MTPAALRGAAPHLVLEIVIGGQRLYLTDGPPLTLPARTPGESAVDYEPGLSVSGLSRVLSWFAGDLSPRTASCEVVMGADLSALFATGVSLEADEAELAEAWPDGDYEDRRVLLRGRASEPLWGGAGEILAFSVTENPGDDRSLLPPATAVVSSATFPRPDTTARGAVYSGSCTEGYDPRIAGQPWPIVLGWPGQTSATASSAWYDGETPATPALVVERDLDGTPSTTTTDYAILIAWGAVEASVVRLWNRTDENLSDLTAAVQNGRDKLGQTFSYVSPSSSGEIPLEGDELWVSWPASGGGLSDPYGPGALRRADHVVRWALGQSTLRVDPSGCVGLSALRGLAFDGYINDPASVWDWLRAVILPLLPAAVVSGPDGLGVLAWQAEPTEHDTVVELVEGENCERLTPIASVGDDIVNRVTVRYAPSGPTGAATLSATVTGTRSAEELDDPSVVPSPWARASQRLYGVRTREIEARCVYDPATAYAIGLWVILAYSLPRRSVGVRVGRELAWLRPGHVVELTLADVHVAQRAHVEAVVPETDGSSSLSLTWWDPLVYAV